MSQDTRSTRKQQVVNLLKAIETGASEPLAAANPAYIQHNLAVPDGVAGLRAVIEQLPEGSARVKTVRVFQDGDYVFAHTEYNFFGPKIGFDIFRFENGTIVEHWDNLQQTAGPNPSGRSMIDGPTTALDLDATEENKRLARAFVDDVLVSGRTDRLARYVNGDAYVQHNPGIGDGRSSLLSAVEALAKQGIAIEYDRIHTVLGEGSFVLVVSEGSFGGRQTSFYDLFRIENERIAEHWDTMEAIPARGDWKNENGKFGF